MATTDPRVLIPLLEDTQQNLNRVTNDCMASQEKALLTQRNLNEHFVRFQQRTWGLGEQVDRDSKAAASTLQAVEAAQGRASETYDKANRIRAKALQILNKSERTQKHWESEVNRACCRLEKAEDWVRKAEQRFANAKQWVTVATERVRAAMGQVEVAEGQVQACEHRLSAARSARASAEAAFNTCRAQVNYVTDSEGNTRVSYPDCSGYEAAVRQAGHAIQNAEIDLRRMHAALDIARKELQATRIELSKATSELAAAKTELIDAQTELAEAKLDLERCQIALKKSKKAVQLATTSTEHAGISVDLAVQANEAAEIARKEIEQVLDWNQRQKRLVEDLDLLVRQAENAVEQSAMDSRQSDMHGMRALEFVHSCDHNLARRIDLLHELERTVGLL